jgi:outer membrane protein assembly factor BamB
MSGVVFVGVGDRGILAVDGRTGVVLASSEGNWVPRQADFSFTAPAIGKDGSVFIGIRYPDYFLPAVPLATLARFTADLQVAAWETMVNYEVTSPVIGESGDLFVGSAGSSPIFCFAFDAAGGTRWSTGFGATFGGSAGSLLLDDVGVAYVIGDVFDPSGPPVLYALDAVLGRELWSKRPQSRFTGDIGLAPGGLLLAGETNGHFHAIQTSSSGLANSPWPTVTSDAANSSRLAYSAGPVGDMGVQRGASREGILISSDDTNSWLYVVERSRSLQPGDWRPFSIVASQRKRSTGNPPGDDAGFFRLRSSE